MKHNVRKGSAYAAIVVITLVAVLFIGYYVMIGPFANLYSRFMDDSEFAQYETREECLDHTGSWTGTTCQQLPDRAKEVMISSRRSWLIAPIIFIVGLIFWAFSTAIKKEPHDYYR